jgi:hypothetical protein
MNHQVFICYASEDKPTADAVCAILEENRVRCWIAPRDVLAAEDYGQAIVHSLSASRLVVFVFSAHANASPHVTRELEGAVSHGIPILPFRIEDAIPSDSLQYYLGGIHWLDALTPPLEAHLQHLAGTVRILLDRDEQVPSANRAPPAPPPGPPVERTGPDARRGGLRRAWLIGLGVLVVVGVGIGAAVALSGGGGSGGSSGGSSGGGGQYLALAQKSCGLVNRADFKTVYGSRPGPGKPDGSNGLCDYGPLFPSVAINQEGAIQADYNSFRQRPSPGAVDVPGLGGGAFEEPANGLMVFDAKRRIIFQLLFRDSSPAGTQQLVHLARLTLARA